MAAPLAHRRQMGSRATWSTLSVLFDRFTAVTLARDFVEIIEAVIASPDRPLTELVSVSRIQALPRNAAIR